MARKQVIAELDHAVAMAVEFFQRVDEHLLDGDQSARDVISHLVFWHGEYVRFITALADRRNPQLLTGKFYEYNARATPMFASQSLPDLARQLAKLQIELACALNRLEDWRADFSIKQGMKYGSLSKRLPQMIAHIDGHVKRLERVEKRKQKRS